MIKNILVIFITQSLFAQTVTISYNYDNISRLKSVSYTTGQSLDYTYDKAGNMTKVVTSDSSVDCNDGDPLTIDSYNDATSQCEHVADSDGDGIPDSSDTNSKDGPYGDNDGDSQLNYIDEDDDNDGMPDDYEKFYGLDQFDASDASIDSDGDGVSNLREYQAGTDPTNDTEFPKSILSSSVIMYLLN